VLVVSLAPLGAQAKPEWDDLYREAIAHVSRQEWKLAEDKLQAAIKSGPPSGRGVIRRRVFNRNDYFPEFYLGIVYLNTNRAAEARTQFNAARKGNVNVREREFERLPEYESRAKELADAAAKERAKPTPAQQFKTLLDQAQRSLGESRYEEAENTARSARGLNVDNGAADELLQDIGRARATARVQEALKGSPSLAELQRLLSEYGDSGAALDEVRKRIAAGEAVQRRNTAERAAMIAYYGGNYGQSIAALSEAEQSGAGLTARGQFYRAVTLAAQATRGKVANQNQLREARKAWAIANAHAEEFKADLRYISPQILQLLRGS
jgi:hypothetical protein